MQLILEKYNEASAPLLAQDENSLDLFIRALRTSTQPHPDIPSCQIMALEQVRLRPTGAHRGNKSRSREGSLSSMQISKPFFSALGDETVQQKLLSVMFDLLVESRSPLVAISISSVFKAVRTRAAEQLY